MTVWPGFGGQSFMRECLPKIETIANCLRDDQWLQVDGGINLGDCSQLAVTAGADTLVAGTAIYGSPDPGATRWWRCDARPWRPCRYQRGNSHDRCPDTMRYNRVD